MPECQLNVAGGNLASQGRQRRALPVAGDGVATGNVAQLCRAIRRLGPGQILSLFIWFRGVATTQRRRVLTRIATIRPAGVNLAKSSQRNFARAGAAECYSVPAMGTIE